MKKTIITVVVIVAIVALLVLPKLFKGEQKVAPTTGSNPATQVLSVDATVIKAVAFDKKLVVTGSILANESVELKSEVSGKIQKIYFTEGQFVKKGDLLLKIGV